MSRKWPASIEQSKEDYDQTMKGLGKH